MQIRGLMIGIPRILMIANTEEHGLSQSAFYRWRQRLEQLDDPEFVEVEVTGGDAQLNAVMFEIEIRDGMTVRVPAGFDSVDLRNLLESVRAPC